MTQEEKDHKFINQMLQIRRELNRIVNHRNRQGEDDSQERTGQTEQGLTPFRDISQKLNVEIEALVNSKGLKAEFGRVKRERNG